MASGSASEPRPDFQVRSTGGDYSGYLELSGTVAGLASTRLAEDRARSGQPRMAAEERLASALDQIGRGTHTPQGGYAVGLWC